MSLAAIIDIEVPVHGLVYTKDGDMTYFIKRFDRTKEELALPLNGKKNNLKRRDFIDYFAIERLQINKASISNVLDSIYSALPIWRSLLQNNFLSDHMKEKYLTLLENRIQRLYS